MLTPRSLNDLPKVDIKGNGVLTFHIKQAKGSLILISLRLCLRLNIILTLTVLWKAPSREKPESSTTSLLVGRSSSAYYLPTIDNNGGYSASVSFAPTTNVDKNLQKVIFKDNYRSGSNYSTGVAMNPTSGNYSSMRGKSQIQLKDLLVLSLDSVSSETSVKINPKTLCEILVLQDLGFLPGVQL